MAWFSKAAKEIPAAHLGYDINSTGDGVVIKRYTGSESELNIPALIEGFPVKEIDNLDYNSKKKNPVTSIIVPAGVTSFSVSEYEKLRTVTLPTGVIKVSIFKCGKLDTITLPDSVREVSFYGSGTYGDDLKFLSLPEGVTSVSFSRCASLGTIILPGSVTKIPAYAFSDCTSLRAITLSDNITEIGEHAFLNCTSLLAIILPKNLKQFCYSDKYCNVFEGCTRLVSVTFQSDIEEIPRRTFDGCTALKTLNINGNIGSIDGSYDNAFSHCSNLTTVNIGANVTKIGDVDALINAGGSEGNHLSLASKAALTKFREA
ncbi:leucine-rich repeat domain-containing protein [Treponema primitia]|uniref:leucine-rich repeat domain-containing protein n=1 Tax=Treponema primitia TaxID=88058 RepID=UPI0039806BC1